MSSFEPTENYHPTLQLVLPFGLFWITVHKNKSMIAAFKGTVQHKDQTHIFPLTCGAVVHLDCLNATRCVVLISAKTHCCRVVQMHFSFLYHKPSGYIILERRQISPKLSSSHTNHLDGYISLQVRGNICILDFKG